MIPKRPHFGPEDIGHCAMPSDDFGVPLLDLEAQATRLDLPFCRWGRQRRKSRMRGTWHFMTDDRRFTGLWARPYDLLNSGCVSAVECNYSVTDDTPLAVALYLTYRKRYLARLWQDLGGVRILVDLNVSERHAVTNLCGVPRGWGAYCTRGSVTRMGALDADLARATEHAAGEKLLFVVYGGGAAVVDWCRDRGVFHFPEEREEVRLGERWQEQDGGESPLHSPCGDLGLLIR